MERMVEIFKNPEFGEIRVRLIDGEPWFVGKDVATILGYGNSREAIIDHVDEEDKRIVQLSDIQEGSEILLPDHMKGSKIVIINESGLYSLILRSNLPSAKSFKSWITHEVLPSIRKTGGYKAMNLLGKDWDNLDAKVKFVFNNVERVKKLLNLGDNDALFLFNKALPNTGAPMDLIPLPEYTESKGVHKSASELLKANGCALGTKEFNLLMEEKGFLEKKYRKSRKDPKREKYFWNLTEKGLKYGVNLVNPNNRSETQPHYFEEKFKELAELST